MSCIKCLKIGPQLKDVVKQKRHVRSAVNKGTTKISAPVPKSEAATEKQTTRLSQGTGQYLKRDRNFPDPNQRTHTQTT